MQGVLNVLTAIWEFFTTYILRNAPFMIGFITLLGYALMRKKWYDILSGTLKAIIGMLILNVGSGGLVSNFRPILAGLKDRFNLVATVIDPYYGQNAVTAGVEEQFGAAFSSALTLLLIAFLVNRHLGRLGSRHLKLQAGITQDYHHFQILRLHEKIHNGTGHPLANIIHLHQFLFGSISQGFHSLKMARQLLGRRLSHISDTNGKKHSFKTYFLRLLDAIQNILNSFFSKTHHTFRLTISSWNALLESQQLIVRQLVKIGGSPH